MVYSRKKKSTVSKTIESNKAERDRSSPAVPIDQRPSQEALEGGEHIFFEVEDFAIVTLDLKGNITSWNKGAEKIKGYSRQEVIGKNVRIFCTPEDREKKLAEKLLSEAKANGRTAYEGWRVRKDGSRFWGSVSLTALHDQAGRTKGFLKVTQDLTERKTQEDQFGNYLEELKQKNAELNESKQRYHRMVSEVQDYAIILLDREGKILDWNQGAEKVKGYTDKEIIGKNFRLFYPKEDRDNKLPEYLLSEAERKGSVIHEGWRIKKDGKRFWANVTITALHNDDRALIGFSKVTRDLTERKIAEDRVSRLMEELWQANESLKDSEERYQRMVAEVKDYAIVLLDPDGNIQNWNQGAELIKGYTSSEIMGKNFRIFYLKEDQAAGLPDKLIGEATRKGRVAHEGWRIRKNGTRFWGSVVITALHNPEGNIIGFSKVTRDLTDKKLSEDSLKSIAAQLDLKNKALERLNEELASFTNVASHDLKEPLRKIQTFAHMIKDPRYDPVKTEESVNKIIDSSERMQALIHDLLSYSQVAAANEKIRDVDLKEIISAVEADLEVMISERQARIERNDLPVVKGISHQLHQLFLNLISNAIKFSKPDVPPVVAVHAKLIKGPDIPGNLPNGKNQYYHITVKDNGIGFESQEAHKIFDPFFRLHPKGVYGGSGLGLSIVKKVIANHNGVVTAESKPGVGSSFHIYLPAN